MSREVHPLQLALRQLLNEFIDAEDALMVAKRRLRHYESRIGKARDLKKLLATITAEERNQTELEHKLSNINYRLLAIARRCR